MKWYVIKRGSNKLNQLEGIMKSSRVNEILVKRHGDCH
jgi:hypothetical protein